MGLLGGNQLTFIYDNYLELVTSETGIILDSRQECRIECSFTTRNQIHMVY